MSGPEVPARRAPPAFEAATVVGTELIGRRLAQLTLHASSLAGCAPSGPAASVRLLLPESDALVIPEWNGNEFLLPDGGRPGIRTLTPARVDPIEHTLAVMVVLHGAGRLSTWANAVEVGAPTAYSGPGRGYEIDPNATRYLLAGDESALPAIMQLLAAIPATVPIHVVIETAEPAGRVPLPDHPNADITWVDLGPGDPPGTALVAAVVDNDTPAESRVWIAGEAAAVQRIRRHLFETRAFPRAHCTIRGYWKHGRVGT